MLVKTFLKVILNKIRVKKQKKRTKALILGLLCFLDVLLFSFYIIYFIA